jgi:hypothetical protein
VHEKVWARDSIEQPAPVVHAAAERGDAGEKQVPQRLEAAREDAADDQVPVDLLQSARAQSRGAFADHAREPGAAARLNGERWRGNNTR